MSSKNWTEGLQSANLTSYEDFTRGLALLLFNTLKSTTNPILNAGVSKLNPGQIDFGLEKKNETFAMSFVFEENVAVKDVNILAVHILLADRDLDTVKSLKSISRMGSRHLWAWRIKMSNWTATAEKLFSKNLFWETPCRCSQNFCRQAIKRVPAISTMVSSRFWLPQ